MGFPPAGATTANLGRLPTEKEETEPFAQLKELAEVMRWEALAHPSVEGLRN
ncbi:MAG: hypothetical protein KatS3mg026_0267 [Bacteroidia bacterium]|nr:MAG: hypothetical protein KatS3mg026_0267 [Bacteroidia bacterium]